MRRAGPRPEYLRGFIMTSFIRSSHFRMHMHISCHVDRGLSRAADADREVRFSLTTFRPPRASLPALTLRQRAL